MTMISRRTALLLAASTLCPPLPALAGPMRVTLYKNPQCDCCEGYADYLRQNDFTVETVPANDLITMARQAGVPESLDGCHITMIDGYVVIGHVPIDAIRKLLRERPKIIGISLPGMPMGVPGMPGPRSEPIGIYEIVASAASPEVFTTEP
jgi:hypothetical protein